MTEERKNEGFREGLHSIADRVADGANYGGKLLGRLARYSKKTFNDALETGKNYHEGIQRNGGYSQYAREIGQEISDYVSGAYKSVEEAFFTDGEFDPEKAKKVLNNKKKAVGKFGEKTYITFLELSKDYYNESRNMVKKTIDFYIPTDEELNTKYAGIGPENKAIYLKPHYDACLKFYDEAGEKMPVDNELRMEILRDIKSSASTTKEELLGYYAIKIMNSSKSGSYDSLTPNKLIDADKFLK